jgi:hypothetical protein
MKKLMLVAVAVAVAVVGVVSLKAADDAPKHTIKQVMEKAHKGNTSIIAKVKSGSASAEEKAALVELYTALGQNKPPKGDADSWKTKTEALLTAAKAVAAGEDDGVKKLNAAANCMGCHSAHRGA